MKINSSSHFTAYKMQEVNFFLCMWHKRSQKFFFRGKRGGVNQNLFMIKAVYIHTQNWRSLGKGITTPQKKSRMNLISGLVVPRHWFPTEWVVLPSNSQLRSTEQNSRAVLLTMRQVLHRTFLLPVYDVTLVRTTSRHVRIFEYFTYLNEYYSIKILFHTNLNVQNLKTFEMNE